ncbi:2Fe-2S iron-sulfur cluster-binding protein [Streptomyces sp. NPDC020412]|uniref:2Fe-2S iron-sulfur cluster-binding protein n=1 Tax=Streptomyces sp. NPDC020412 TaxID=3365073 RepID=UPI0037B27443
MPQGAFEQDATAFVQLPPDEALHAAPLEAPGHGYVPPMILPLTPVADPQVPQEALTQPPQGPGGWPEAPGSASSVPSAASAVPYTDDPHATAQWAFPDADQSTAPTPAPASDVTGQWTIPVARGDLPEETGEYTAATLQAQQWSSPPPTLPGGAPAPWAADAPTTLPGGAPAPWATGPEPPQAEAPADGLDASAPRPAPENGGYDTGAHAPAAPVAHPAQPHPVPVEAQEEQPETPAPADGHQAAVDAPETAAPAPVAPETVAPDPVEPEPAASETPAPEPEAAPEEPSAGAVPAPRTAAPEAPEGPEAPDAAEAPADVPPPAFEEHPPTSYVLRVNGTDRPVTDAWIGESLLYVLRERLGLAGAKDGCSQGECGACNVQVDGRLVASCLVPAATAAGSEVRTVEGLATDGEPSDVQRALAACGAVQCGFCIPGMAMTVHDLLEGNHNPTELETRQALCGNLCRCSGYRGVLDAVKQVVTEREASAAALADDAAAAEATAGADLHGPTGSGPDPLIPHQAPPGAGSVQPHPHDGGMA